MFERVKAYFPIIALNANEGLSVQLQKEELEHVPRRYRWLLKLFLKFPSPGFPFFVLKRLPEIEGFFWTVGVPIFLLLYFLFSIWFFAFLSSYVIFPFNVLFGLLVPAVFFVFFLRIELERTILWWRNLQTPSKQWDIPQAVEELAQFLKEQRQRKERRAQSQG